MSTGLMIETEAGRAGMTSDSLPSHIALLPLFHNKANKNARTSGYEL
jgi:hypothetical protein